MKKKKKRGREEEDEVKLTKTAITDCDAVGQKYRHIRAVLSVTAVMVLSTIMMTSSEIYAWGYVIYAGNATYALFKEQSRLQYNIAIYLNYVLWQ